MNVKPVTKQKQMSLKEFLCCILKSKMYVLANVLCAIQVSEPLYLKKKPKLPVDV